MAPRGGATLRRNCDPHGRHGFQNLGAGLTWAVGLAICIAGAASAPVARASAPELVRAHLSTAAGDSVTFPIGPGATDVIPHQIIRTHDDRLYVFASQGQYT